VPCVGCVCENIIHFKNKDVAIRNGPNSSRLHAVHANGNISIGNIADVYGTVKGEQIISS
jgi:hypothetical protein